MNYSVVCHGCSLFGFEVPPFTLEKGGLLIVRARAVTDQSEYARLLLAEALCGGAMLPGIDIQEAFVCVHPHLRARAWGADVARQVLRGHVTPALRKSRAQAESGMRPSLYDVVPNIAACISGGLDFVFSFMALGGESRLRIRELLLTRPAHITAIGIEGVTTNFSVEEFLPGQRILELRES